MKSPIQKKVKRGRKPKGAVSAVQVEKENVDEIGPASFKMDENNVEIENSSQSGNVEEDSVEYMISKREKEWNSKENDVLAFTRKNVQDFDIPLKVKLLKFRIVTQFEDQEFRRECLANIFSQEQEESQEEYYEILKAQVGSISSIGFCEQDSLTEILQRIEK